MSTSRVDLAITFPDYIPSSYHSISLFTEHHVCVASKKSKLAKRKLSLKEISLEPQIVASPSRPNFKGSVDAWFEEAGLTRNIVISAPCFSVVPGYIETTDAIAFLPSRAPINDSLEVIQLNESPMNFDVIAAWHSRSDKDPLHNWVIDLLKREYKI